MRLLITRPLKKAEATAKRLIALGHQPIVAPVMRLAPRAFKLPKEQDIMGLIVTSPTALEMLKREDITGLQSIPLYHTGVASAELAKSLGFKSCHYLGERVDDLIKVFKASDLPKGLFLYLAGEERSRDLHVSLTDAARQVALIELYGAEPVEAFDEPVRLALSQRAVDGALLYSKRSATLFCRLLAKEGLMSAARGLTFFCLSAEIAQSLKAEMPEAEVMIADEASEAGMMALLRAKE